MRQVKTRPARYEVAQCIRIASKGQCIWLNGAGSAGASAHRLRCRWGIVRTGHPTANWLGWSKRLESLSTCASGTRKRFQGPSRSVILPPSRITVGAAACSQGFRARSRWGQVVYESRLSSLAPNQHVKVRVHTDPAFSAIGRYYTSVARRSVSVRSKVRKVQAPQRILGVITATDVSDGRCCN
jgi:hypothetical protein